MASLKEIVTKAVIGKTKKTMNDTFNVVVDNNVNNVLGCWIINHNFNGSFAGNDIDVKGSYDVNIWYSYDNNTKTNVIVHSYNYTDKVNIKLKDHNSFSDKNEILVRSLSDPSVSDVKVDGNNIKLTINKELAVEVVGDMLVRVNVLDDIDDFDSEDNNENLDIEVKEDYLG